MKINQGVDIATMMECQPVTHTSACGLDDASLVASQLGDKDDKFITVEDGTSPSSIASHTAQRISQRGVTLLHIHTDIHAPFVWPLHAVRELVHLITITLSIKAVNAVMMSDMRWRGRWRGSCCLIRRCRGVR